MEQRIPIGQMHARDFGRFREQRTLAELTADAEGHVRFACLKCPRTGRMPLAALQARFQPTDGLVNILNAVAPKDCPHAVADPSGNRPCGFCYRDLA